MKFPAFVLPAVFVVLWSTGYVCAKLGLADAEPLTFLSLRFCIVAVLLLIVSLATRAPWPGSVNQWLHLCVAGVLVHALYLGGVYAGITSGVDAGVSATVMAIQPVLTALLASVLLKEAVSRGAWTGFVLGFAGVLLVVSDRFGGDGHSLSGLILHIISLIGISIGLLYQKRFCENMDLRSGSCIQFAAAGLVTLVLALVLENRDINWTPSFIFALTWLSVVLSVGAISLLWVLIRRGQASRVSSLFYLVPPCVAVLAWIMFRESLGPEMLAGMVLICAGVALVNRPPRRTR